MQQQTRHTVFLPLMSGRSRLQRIKDFWPTVAAKVEGTQEIPDRAIKSITVKLNEAHVGSDICINGARNINRVGIEPTLSRLREGHLSEESEVNISGAPITLKHGLQLGQCLVYDKAVSSVPEELPFAYI